MDYYNLLKFVHILLAVIWVGGALTIQILAFRIMKEKNGPRLASLSHDAGFMGEKVFAPVSGLLLIMGILMVIDRWEFSQTWVIIGLVGWAATLVTGLFYLSPTSKKLGEMLDARGPDDPEAQATIKKLLAISRMDAVVLILVIYNMVEKPGL